MLKGQFYHHKQLLVNLESPELPVSMPDWPVFPQKKTKELTYTYIGITAYYRKNQVSASASIILITEYTQ